MSMHYLPTKELHEEHSRPCPTCHAEIGHWCISESGGRNTKSHAARMAPKPVHTPLPDMRDKWKEWAQYEGVKPKPRPKDLQV